MGQAKSRGSFLVRKAQSEAKLKANAPESIDCNQCGFTMTELTVMDTRHMDGIDFVCAGICPQCTYQTWAMNGEPDALSVIREALAIETGTAPTEKIQRFTKSA
jgi:hypothetical protein